MAQKYSLFIFILTFVAGCKQVTEKYPDIPQLVLVSVDQVKLNGKDSIMNITLGYKDGDGDIGLNVEDTLPPYNYPSKYFNNILINVYRIDGGITSRVTTPPPAPQDTITFSDRIVNLTPTGKSRSISGEIKLFIKSLPYPGVTPDSMFYTFQLVDRALHESNTVTTNIMRFEF